MPRDPRVLLDDMLEALSRIESFTEGFRRSTLTDARTFDAVVRNLEVLGEAAKKMPETVRVELPDVEWRKIASLRDILIHEYFGIDAGIIEDVVANKLPALAEHIRKYHSR